MTEFKGISVEHYSLEPGKPDETFTIHDMVIVHDKNGINHEYTISFVADKKLKPEQIKQALQVLKDMVVNKI